MSVIKGKTNQYGPATLDVQIEQGADFILGMELTRTVGVTTTPWDLTSATLEAHASSEWSPGGVCIPFTVEPVDLANGKVRVVFPAASSLTIPIKPLPYPPKKTTGEPMKFLLGGWVMNVTDGGATVRVVEGTVYLDRDPCQM